MLCTPKDKAITTLSSMPECAIMSKYDDLLKEAKAKAEAFTLTAKEYIPKMYNALREEDPNISPDDARDRIQKDCVGIWSRRTVLEALPSEAKDPKKQKAGRLSRMEHISAAFSAAQRMLIAKKEIQINTSGKCIAPDANQSNNGLDSNISQRSQYNEELEHYHNILLEFSLPRGDIMGRLIDDLAEVEDKDTPLWFSGEIDRHSGNVINARIGRSNIKN
jgi:hypothetical protein